MDDVASLDILTNIDLLRNPRAPIEARRQAAQYLAENPNTVAIPVIIKALDDPDYQIRKSAIESCAFFNSPLTVDGLVKVVRERTFSEREEAIRILGRIKDARALQPIAESLLNSDWMSIRSTAAAALGDMGFALSVEALIEGLSDPEAPVRANAAEALGRIGNADAVQPLIQALREEKGWNIRHIADALAQIGEPAIKPLISILANTDEDQRNREMAAETLAEIISTLPFPDKSRPSIKLAIDLLVAELPKRNKGVRNHIARAALTRVSGVVADQLIQAFANSDADLRDQVAYILGDSTDPELNAKLIKALDVANEQVAAGAARVLYFRGQNPRDYGYTGPL